MLGLALPKLEAKFCGGVGTAGPGVYDLEVCGSDPAKPCCCCCCCIWRESKLDCCAMIGGVCAGGMLGGVCTRVASKADCSIASISCGEGSLDKASS